MPRSMTAAMPLHSSKKITTAEAQLPLVKCASFSIPVAFHDTDQGAEAALLASMEAMNHLAELHVELAIHRLLALFADHPELEAISWDQCHESDDEGHDYLRIEVVTSYTDGSKIPNYDYHRADSDEADHRELHEEVGALLGDLARTLPLARGFLESHVLSRKILAINAGPAFASRQEAFALERELPEAGRAPMAPRL